MSNLMESWRQVVAEAPNFVTDERADIKDNNGVTKRTYRFLALSTLLAKLKPLFDKHGIMFTQPINYQYAGDGKGMQVPTVDTVIFNGEESQTLSRYPIFSKYSAQDPFMFSCVKSSALTVSAASAFVINII